jgi:hypothetical protein
MKKYRPVSLKRVKTAPISKRKSKVSLSEIALPFAKGETFKEFCGKLPDILAGKDFRAVVNAVVKARRNDRPVVLGMGAHPVKVGISPLIVDLMRRGIITAIATNGACIIHDFEMSYTGRTSEDVGKELCGGTFGMAVETGQYLNRAIKSGIRKGYGIGRAVGEMIYRSSFRFREYSLFCNAFQLAIPATVHVAIGTDIIHMHPDADGSAIGEGSFRDFKLFASVISSLEEGVYINLGSAVIMPEVFLKALTVARNLGSRVENITTVNMDFMHHYRPSMNVLKRPTLHSGACYALTGHHEVMFPLLAAAVIEEMG